MQIRYAQNGQMQAVNSINLLSFETLDFVLSLFTAFVTLPEVGDFVDIFFLEAE